jgi:hypothetical protein
MDIVVRAMPSLFSFQEIQRMSIEATRRVLLYGNSIILGSIGAGLRQSDALEVTACESPIEDPNLLDSLQPDIILFDSEATQAEGLLPLLESYPSVLLIGVSPDVNLVRVWSGHQLREMSLKALVEIITGETRRLD